MSGYITDAFRHQVGAAGTQRPLFWSGEEAPDGDVSPWASAPTGSLYVRQPDATSQPALYFKIGMTNSDADWGAVSFTVQRSGSPIGLLLALTHP